MEETPNRYLCIGLSSLKLGRAVAQKAGIPDDHVVELRNARQADDAIAVLPSGAELYLIDAERYENKIKQHGKSLLADKKSEVRVVGRGCLRAKELFDAELESVRAFWRGPTEPAPRTVAQALEWAERDFPKLIIWPSARRSAANSWFGRPAEVYRALRSIAESLNPGQDLETWFGARGTGKFAGHESKQTMNLYGSERKFSFEGGSHVFVMHLTLGGGSATDCLQIYFEHREDKTAVDVGWCGKHLPYATQG